MEQFAQTLFVSAKVGHNERSFAQGLGDLAIQLHNRFELKRLKKYGVSEE